MTHKASILLAHGSSDPHWLTPFQALANTITQRLQQQAQNNGQQAVRTELAFMELAEPSLENVIRQLAAEGFQRIEILPLFFAAGQHLRRDVPATLNQLQQSLAEQGLKVELQLQGPVGLEQEVADAIGDIVLRQLG